MPQVCDNSGIESWKYWKTSRKIKAFTDQYDWNNISFPTGSKDQNKFGISNKTIDFNVVFAPHNMVKIWHAYVLKHDSKCEHQAILLMTTNGEKWHYFTAKDISGLLFVITSTYNNESYFMNCHHSFRTKRQTWIKRECLKK